MSAFYKKFVQLLDKLKIPCDNVFMLGRVKKKSKNSVVVENINGVKRFYCSAKNELKNLFTNVGIDDFVNIGGEKEIYSLEIIEKK